MSDCINLLPDAVANQIAAGEVIQRPASVVKELVENAVDSGASKISIIIRDAGKTLIQVIDDGKGMSETDARMAFERHATSKITKAEDLFTIKTKGFRGEALASIAAVASVDLKTCQEGENLGTHLRIAASIVELQEADACPQGSNFAVKNLFYNIPARRKFLKSDQTELKHIINEVQRVALVHPGIQFKLVHNEHDIFNLNSGNVKQRIVGVFGRQIENSLIDVKVDTDIVKIRGYIGKPDKARKTSGEQYFFVNRRYVRHPYFYRAVMNAYERLVKESSYPQFFIYFDIDPGKIDINIHPSKTEIKFIDERPIFQMLYAAVKESLGKFNMVPSLDFDKDETLNIYTGSNSEFRAPEISVNTDFNPFEDEKSSGSGFSSSTPFQNVERQNNAGNIENWQSLYPPKDGETGNDSQTKIPNIETEQTQFFQVKQKYIITTVKSGMMVIDQTRAHERILYEKFVTALENRQAVVQKELYPQSVQLSPEDTAIIIELIDKFNNLGFDLSVFGDNSFVINGLPADISGDKPKELLEELLENYKSNTGDIKLALDERIAYAMSRTSARHFVKVLNPLEMQELFYQLMSCKIHNYTPSGKAIISIISVEELEKRLK